MFYWLLCENSASARVLRTILQGIVAVFVASLPQVQDLAAEALFALGLPELMVLAIVPAVMALLSPIMAKVGAYIPPVKQKGCVVCDAEDNVISLEEALSECPEQPNFEDCAKGDDNG